jgi:hypothetical protein
MEQGGCRSGFNRDDVARWPDETFIVAGADGIGFALAGRPTYFYAKNK